MSFDDTVPSDAVPSDTVPSESVPSESTPEETVATDTVASYDGPANEVAPVTVEAAGLVDNVMFFLPFVFDPTAIREFLAGVRWLTEETTWTGKWNGFKKCGDVAFPLIDRYQARLTIAPAAINEEERSEYQAAAEASQLVTFAACEARVEALRLGDGQLLGRLRDAFGKLQGLKDSPLGQELGGMLMKLILLKLTGGLAPLSQPMALSDFGVSNVELAS